MGAWDTKRVLVLDDEPASLRLIENGLTRQIVGISVVTHGKAWDAITAFREAEEGGQPFSLVIADVNLGEGMDGPDAVKYMIECRTVSQYKGTPLKVIIMSANSGNETDFYRNRVLGGFSGNFFVLKPFGITSFVESVLKVLAE